ncbi:hypothetical protein H2198_001873 [Neophaeococcomyces mojaviensis]|uniref:Uncharacterized protein n=1 Tax=Neophaeococcomyces mojaviensis TaxID=3383035 RepID=A0ACC3AFL1_9EURO|nr:hypothetical protein H2198_001873 [Knufia sp. JES_112]
MCIDQLCSVGDNSVNLAIATSIYLGYCTARGFTALRVQNTAETSSPSDFSTTTASTRSAPASATSTSLSDTTTPSLTSPSNTLTIALASVGAVAVIAILVAAISCWKIRRKKIRANPGPYNLGTWPTSTLQLRPSGESRLSGGVTDVTPSDSISQVDQPGMMGPSYPQYSDPSTISTNYRGYGASTVGPGRSTGAIAVSPFVLRNCFTGKYIDEGWSPEDVQQELQQVVERPLSVRELWYALAAKDAVPLSPHLSLHKTGHYRVITTGRNLSKLWNIEKAGIEEFQLDVLSKDSISTAVKPFEALTCGRLDRLINNAGEQHTMPTLDVDAA